MFAALTLDDFHLSGCSKSEFDLNDTVLVQSQFTQDLADLIGNIHLSIVIRLMSVRAKRLWHRIHSVNTDTVMCATYWDSWVRRHLRERPS